MKFTKEWMLGGSTKNEELDDYISAYIADNGMRIECGYGFSNFSNRWYEVNGLYFSTLKEAKQYCMEA